MLKQIELFFEMVPCAIVIVGFIYILVENHYESKD